MRGPALTIPNRLRTSSAASLRGLAAMLTGAVAMLSATSAQAQCWTCVTNPVIESGKQYERQQQPTRDWLRDNPPPAAQPQYAPQPQYTYEAEQAYEESGYEEEYESYEEQSYESYDSDE